MVMHKALESHVLVKNQRSSVRKRYVVVRAVRRCFRRHTGENPNVSPGGHGAAEDGMLERMQVASLSDGQGLGFGGEGIGDSSGKLLGKACSI